MVNRERGHTVMELVVTVAVGHFGTSMATSQTILSPVCRQLLSTWCE